MFGFHRPHAHDKLVLHHPQNGAGLNQLCVRNRRISFLQGFPEFPIRPRSTGTTK